MEVNTEFNINITKTNNSKIDQVDFDNIPFGQIYSDHMLVANFVDGKWDTPEIKPFENMSYSPAMSALHYGQSIFEGMKAFKTSEGAVQLFRPYENLERLNKSARRMSMEEIPEDIFIEGLKQLVALDKDWVPGQEGSSLYIRPLLFATDEYIGVKSSKNFTFLIITCPVGKYYAQPVKVLAADKFVRAIPGGVGDAKTAGNYAAAMLPATQANLEGYDQVLWMDGYEFKYTQEIGTMNFFVEIDGKIYTPKLNGAILEGITRDSVITLLKQNGYDVVEKDLSIEEIFDAATNGKLTDAFGSGTAASISHISAIGWDGKEVQLPAVANRKVSNWLYEQLEGIKTGKVEDANNWNTPV
jgi:branched-chain amino acid aminotransferase